MKAFCLATLLYLITQFAKLHLRENAVFWFPVLIYFDSSYLSTFSFLWCFLPLYTLFCCCVVAKPCLTLLQPHELWPARLLCPWDFPGKNTAVGWHSLPQGGLPNPGIESMSLHCKQILYCLSHQGPKMPHGVSVILDLETHFWCTSGHTSFFRRPQKHLSVLEQPLPSLVAGLIHDDWISVFIFKCLVSCP